MPRVYNFSAGPAILPEPVLREAAAEMLDYRGTGMSVMEMSHRSAAYKKILEEAEADLRELMQIPQNYKVLFLQGGAHQQFTAIPMNLMKQGTADYIITGVWAEKAYKEACRFGKARAIASSADAGFKEIPDLTNLDISPDADYVHICQNNTIYGTQYHTLPDTHGVDLVADISSCMLSEPMDVSKYALLYGGAQKNVGPAGVTLVILREDLLENTPHPQIPTMLRYKIHADSGSLYNTPPSYGIYICGKVFKWLKDQGGLSAIEAHNHKKAALLYDYLDNSRLFKGSAAVKDRSYMNVVFSTGSETLDADFIKHAQNAGLVNLKGHRLTGGLRASIYNAMPLAGVEALVEAMADFEKKNP